MIMKKVLYFYLFKNSFFYVPPSVKGAVFALTNAAFVKAKTGFGIANAVFAKANFESVKANAAFAKAKLKFAKANIAFVKTNFEFAKAKPAFALAKATPNQHLIVNYFINY